MRRNVPLTEPEILRDFSEAFTALLLPDRLVDIAKDALGSS